MTNCEARAIEANPSKVVLHDRQVQRLAQIASHVTTCPLQITPGEIDELAQVSGSEAALLEAVGVIAGFNFITRMADALGVDSEIPTWVQQSPPMRNVALRLMALGLRGVMDLRPRDYPGEQAEEDLGLLEKLHQGLGLGALPGFFVRMKTTPHLLRSEREFFEAITEVHGASPERFMAAGRIVLEEVSHSTFLSRIDEWLRSSTSGPTEPLLGAAKAKNDGADRLKSEMRRFAQDMTREASSLTQERVETLRSCGLSDEEILDWTFAIALWNALGRTERLLEREPNLNKGGAPHGGL
jgi:alkylhydroperoxidase family enzyme